MPLNPSPKQRRFLFSSGSPLSPEEKKKLASELRRKRLANLSTRNSGPRGDESPNSQTTKRSRREALLKLRPNTRLA